MPGKCTSILAAAALATLVPVASGAVVLDFETADQFTDNFRKAFGTATATQTSNGAANDFVNVNEDTSYIALYDTTPLVAGSGTGADAFTGPLTVQADVRFPSGGNSFGIFLINADNLAQSHLMLFNLGEDWLRIFPTADPDPDGSGLGTVLYNEQDSGSGVQSTDWATLTVDYAVNEENEPVISLTMGNAASGPITLENITAFDSVSVGIRASPNGNSATNRIEIDNFSIVPEPSALAFASLAGGLLLRRRARACQ